MQVDTSEQNIATQLPLRSHDVVWFQDVGGRSESRRVSHTKPSLHSFADLLRRPIAHEPAARAMLALSTISSAVVAEDSSPMADEPQRRMLLSAAKLFLFVAADRRANKLMQPTR